MRLSLPRTVCGILLIQSLRSAFAQYSYDYSTNYYDDYQLYQAGYQYDEADDGFLFNPYTGSYDDVYGDYFFEDEAEALADCRIDESGKPNFNGVCLELPVKLSFRKPLRTKAGSPAILL